MNKFISIEGTDLAGKTSIIIPYLQSRLDPENNVFVADMKTGEISKGIRGIFMDPNSIIHGETDWVTIAMLASASRSDMVHRVVKPLLDDNKNVFTDRYVDTSYVYNLGSHDQKVADILDYSTHNVDPDIVIFAYCSYDEMVRRKNARDDSFNDHWDIISPEEHQNKIDRYREMFRRNKRIVFEIDTSGDINDVYKKLDEFIEIVLP